MDMFCLFVFHICVCIINHRIIWDIHRKYFKIQVCKHYLFPILSKQLRIPILSTVPSKIESPHPLGTYKHTDENHGDNSLWYLSGYSRQYLMHVAKSLQSCPTPCDPIDCSPPGSPVPGILQARTLEWVAISFSNAWKWKLKVKSLSRVRLSATPWTAAFQAPPSMGFSRQEYWSEVPLPSWSVLGDCPN